MKKRFVSLGYALPFAILGTVTLGAWSLAARGEEPKAAGASPPAASNSSAPAAAPTPPAPPKYPPFADVVKDFETIDGLIKLQYRVQNERQPHLWASLHGSGRKLD